MSRHCATKNSVCRTEVSKRLRMNVEMPDGQGKERLDVKPIYVITAGAAGLAILGFVFRKRFTGRLARRNCPNRALSHLILEAFAADWSGRLMVPANDVEYALLARAGSP